MSKSGSIRAVAIAAVMAIATSGAAAVAGPLEDGEAAHQARDYETALRLLRPLAENEGDPKAQVLVGRMYARGNGVPRDNGEAMRWYTLAADQGDHDAIMNLGDQYQAGVVVARDFDEAERLFRSAAEQGHKMSQIRLVYLYVSGDLNTEQALEAYAWTIVLENQRISVGRELRAQVMAAVPRGANDEGLALAQKYWDLYVVPFLK
jgi:TPR repeat protein